MVDVFIRVVDAGWMSSENIGVCAFYIPSLLMEQDLGGGMGLVIDSTCRRKGRCNEGWSRMVRKWLRFSSLCAIYICGRSIFLETRINLKVEMLIFNCSTNMQIKKYICGIVFIFNGKNLIPFIYSFTIRLLLFKYSIIFRSWKCMNKIIQVSYVKGLCSRIQQRSSLKNSMRDFILCFFQNIKRFDEMCINY